MVGLGRERSVVRGDRGVDPRSALRARKGKLGEGRPTVGIRGLELVAN